MCILSTGRIGPNLMKFAMNVPYLGKLENQQNWDNGSACLYYGACVSNVLNDLFIWSKCRKANNNLNCHVWSNMLVLLAL